MDKICFNLFLRTKTPPRTIDERTLMLQRKPHTLTHRTRTKATLFENTKRHNVVARLPIAVTDEL